MVYEKFTNSETGRIIISIIWGFLLVFIFKLAISNKKCIVIKGPNPDSLKGKVIKFKDSCYKYDTYSVKCKNVGNIPS